MHLLPGLYEATGDEEHQMQDLQGKEQENTVETAASYRPTVPTHSEY